MDRRTFLLRGSAALAAAALAAVLPKQAAAVPATPKPPLLRLSRDAHGVEHVDVVPESPTTTLRVDQYLDDVDAIGEVGWRDADFKVTIMGGEVKIDRFIKHDYVPQPLHLNPTIAARAKALYGDSFYGHPIVATEAYTPRAAMLHWGSRAASGDARLQGPQRRRLLRGR